MLELLVLADDFTGALDTGVQFSRQSIPTLVSTRIETLDQGGEISVLALDLETRHLSAQAAVERVRQAVQHARGTGVEIFYKKTDSTLRGNIGGELEALLHAAGGSLLAFVPAYPQTGRTTVAGRQYVDGVPLHLSPYAADPQNPVRSSSVPRIIAEQSSIAVEVVETPEALDSDRLEREQRRHCGPKILVFDARSDEELQSIAERLRRLGLLRLTAGCAGFAAHLTAVVGLSAKAGTAVECPDQLLVVCGSTNPVSLEQIEAAVQSGMKRIVFETNHLLYRGHAERIPAAEEDPRLDSSTVSRIGAILDSGWDLILQTAPGGIEPARAGAGRVSPRVVAQALGELVARILRSRSRLTPVVFGGDTALAVVEGLGSSAIVPIAQIAPGVVLSRMVCDSLPIPLITKAGGIGSPGIIEEIRGFIRSNPEASSRFSGSC
ncbi:MAG: four-carbon acid sugar kinase family protein [Spirochaetaceae bacterium]|nr:MAG: four-carbon acid sugar kinase family protein [Spirochaetaceae bacterium]